MGASVSASTRSLGVPARSPASRCALVSARTHFLNLVVASTCNSTSPPNTALIICGSSCTSLASSAASSASDSGSESSETK